MAETTTVARPYARAAFEYAQSKKGGLKKWSEALSAAATIASDAGMQALLASPTLSAADKTTLLVDLCRAAAGDKAISDEFCNFVRLLADNGRLRSLVDIAALYEVFRSEAEKTIHAEIISAFEVDDEQKARIVTALKKRFNRDVALECRVDQSLIGGAVIRAGDVVIDGSVGGQLAKFATALRQ